MQKTDSVIAYDFNPTFLYTWKGIRTKDEERYHCHEHVELAFIMSGKGKYKIDGTFYNVEEGDLLVFNPGCYHQAFVADKNTPTYEFFIGVSDFCITGMEPNHFILKQLPIYKTGPELKQKLMRLCTSMSAENDVYKIGRYYMMQSYLMQYMLSVLRDEQLPGEPGGHVSFESINKNRIVEEIILYFEEHYSEKISLELISENMYVSPFYISKIFKMVTGDTPIRYLINIRLDKAKELLETSSDLNVREIADKVGYDDAYHFSKLFKKRFGVSPTAVKKTV